MKTKKKPSNQVALEVMKVKEESKGTEGTAPPFGEDPADSMTWSCSLSCRGTGSLGSFLCQLDGKPAPRLPRRACATSLSTQALRSAGD